ncbi:SDR family NAD(P)-dependent oxidoreductase [Myxococcus sp. MxC21-1]|uniref:SDR family NAD(P)-dependent oxidoreductase n=1 Tax=Myxococcus sp. MxC21-1 TaxID=3041439 RepID=UPI00292FA1CA|nr:SDR family NAD(P)-dependent oxidoreductase [Myxococcus sp. MxC21-1]WNZ66021.1 SDR family NAD(P)-dependent oxidoreductase [Myxococcus sp. MxC21-1]
MGELRASGAEVRVYATDVTRADDVTRLLASMDAELPPLRGIVHAAGVIADGVLAQLDAERLRTVLAPKVQGAWNLHAQTLGRPLDFFVMFSSAASMLGSPGQGNYAAANAFMDVLAHHRRAAGLPALSVNWGPWAEVGRLRWRRTGATGWPCAAWATCRQHKPWMRWGACWRRRPRR